MLVKKIKIKKKLDKGDQRCTNNRAAGWEGARRREERQEPEEGRKEARDGNGKDVQKQDSTRKAVEALSESLQVLALDLSELGLEREIPQHQSTPAHPSRCRAARGRGADLSWEAAEEVQAAAVAGGWGAAAEPSDALTRAW